MYALLIALAAASQGDTIAGDEPVAKPEVYTAANYCADYGDYAFVIMEEVKRGRDAGAMLIEAQNTGANDVGRKILTELVFSAFRMNRVTSGAMTPKRFADEATLECYRHIQGKKNASNKSP